MSSSFAVSSSRAVSSSLAVSSSYSLNSSTAETATTVQTILLSPSSSNYIARTLSVAAGSLFMTGSNKLTVATDTLKNKILGTDLIVNATVFNSAAVVSVRSYNAGTGQIEFQTQGGSTSEFVMWTAYYW